MLRAGHRRLGRRLAGHGRPRQPRAPWPAIDELAARTAEAGFKLRERLTAYPKYVLAGSPWIDTRLHAHVAALADPETGLAREDAEVLGRPWQEPDGGFESTGRTDLNTSIDTDRPHRRPARRLRLRLRRLGRAARGAGRASSRSRRSGSTPTSAPGSTWPRPIRRRCSTRRTTRPRMAVLHRRRRRAGGAGPARRRRAPRRRRRRRHLRGQPEHQLLQRLLRRLPVLRVRPARARRRRVPALARRGRRPRRRRPRRTVPPRSACRAASTRSCRSSFYADLVRAVKAARARHARPRVLPDGDRRPRRRRRACRSRTGSPS